MNEMSHVREGSRGGVARRRGERKHDCESTGDHGSQMSSCSAIQSLYTQYTKQQLLVWVDKYSYLIGERYASLGFPVQTKTSLTLNHMKSMCIYVYGSLGISEQLILQIVLLTV